MLKEMNSVMQVKGLDFALFKFIGIYAAAISTLASSLFLYTYRKFKMKKFFNAYEKNDISILMVVLFLFLLFYINNKVLNIVAVIIALSVSIIFNFHTICVFTKGLRSRIH